MKAQLRTVVADGVEHTRIMFVCPGCVNEHGEGGLHMIPVNSPQVSPQWDWDGNIDAPTLSPSILSKRSMPTGEFVCHSYLRAGVFEFLGDCTHQFAGQHVPMPDLYEWATHD